MGGHLDTTIASYDATAQQYAQKTLDIDTSVQRSRFLSYVPADALLLDAGCGPGRDVKQFADAGYRVTGIDLSTKLLDLARARVPTAMFDRMDVRSLFFPNESFHGIWAMSVLQHLEKSELLLAITEFARVLKTDGVLYFCLKCGTGERLETDTRYGGVQKYYAYYTKDEVLSLLRPAPFELLYAESLSLPNNSTLTAPWMDFYLRKTQ